MRPENTRAMNHPLTNLIEFYGICAQAIAGMPAIYPDGGEELRCQRLNTFAVMKSIKEFDADNGGKSVRYSTAPYYFNRRWIAAENIYPESALDYPVCAVAEESFTLSPTGFDRQVLNLIVADIAPRKEPHASSADGWGICGNRTEEQVADGCRALMKSFLSILGSYIYAEVEFPSETIEGWYNEVWLDAEQTAGNVLGYYEMDRLENYVQTKGITGDVFHMVESGNLVVAVARFSVDLAGCQPNDALVPVYPVNFAPGASATPIFINDEKNAQ